MVLLVNVTIAFMLGLLNELYQPATRGCSDLVGEQDLCLWLGFGAVLGCILLLVWVHLAFEGGYFELFCCHSASHSGTVLSRYCAHCCLGGWSGLLTIFFVFLLTPSSIYSTWDGQRVGEWSGGCSGAFIGCRFG